MALKSRRFPRYWHGSRSEKSAILWSRTFSTVVSGTVTTWSPKSKPSSAPSGKRSNRSTTAPFLRKKSSLRTAWPCAWTSTRSDCAERTSTSSRATRATSKCKTKSRLWRKRLNWTSRIRKISSQNLSIGPIRSKPKCTESLRANRPKTKIGFVRPSTISNLVSRKSTTSRTSPTRPLPSSEITLWSFTIGP